MSEDLHDPLALIRTIWRSTGFTLPGMAAPSLDTDALGKRITDLKTVEAWLETNLRMLQATIQALELQRSTLHAVSNMTDVASKAAVSPDNPFAKWLDISWLSEASAKMMEAGHAVATAAVTPPVSGQAQSAEKPVKKPAKKADAPASVKTQKTGARPRAKAAKPANATRKKASLAN